MDSLSITSSKGNVATQRCDESEIVWGRGGEGAREGGAAAAAVRKGKSEGEYRKNEFPRPFSLSLSGAKREKYILVM